MMFYFTSALFSLLLNRNVLSATAVEQLIHETILLCFYKRTCTITLTL